MSRFGVRLWAWRRHSGPALTRLLAPAVVGALLSCGGEPSTPEVPEGLAWHHPNDTLLLAAPDEQVVGVVSDLAFWDGRLVVVDALQADVKLSDPTDGSLTATVGRRGSGPGEFERPISAAVAPDGRLPVLDAKRMRVLFFRPGGELDTLWSVPGVMAGGMAATADGNLVVTARIFDDSIGVGQQATHVFNLRGEHLKSFGTASAPSHPGESSINHLSTATVGNLILSVPLTSNLVRIHDLSTGREWDQAVGGQDYRAIDWPDEQSLDPETFRSWIQEQMPARMIRGVDSTRFAVGFGEYHPEGREWWYRWYLSVLRSGDSGPGMTIAAAPPVAHDGRIYWVKILDDGSTVLLSGPR